MTSGRPAPAAALALVLSGVAVVLPLSATQRPTSGATSSAPEWLDEAPTSRVSTMHLLAETDQLDGPVPADGRVTLVLRVTPRPGMRIYAHDATGYVPFTLQLDPDRGRGSRPPGLSRLDVVRVSADARAVACVPGPGHDPAARPAVARRPSSSRGR